MNIFITKNGQQLGPYTMAQIQSMVKTGTLSPLDYAWYEGAADWIPLNTVPGYGEGAAAAAIQPQGQRPIGVWIICILYFLCSFCGLIGVGMLPLAANLPTTGQNEAQMQYIHSMGPIDYLLALAGIGLNFAGAVLLFLLRKESLYCFGGALVFSVINLVYEIAFRHWLQSIGSSSLQMASGIAGIAISWIINLGVIGYIWYLMRTRVLR